METIRFNGIDRDALVRALAGGVDQGGNPIESFVDHDGGWPLRCCLGNSRPGDELAIIAWSPFPWQGAYSEIGPIVVHVGECPGWEIGDRLPQDLDRRAMTLRPYGHDRRIAYGQVRHVPEGQSLTEQVRELLADPGLEFVHGRNVGGGCFSFHADRQDR